MFVSSKQATLKRAKRSIEN